MLHIKLANNLQTSASNDTVACSFASSAIEPLACFWSCVLFHSKCIITWSFFFKLLCSGFGFHTGMFTITAVQNTARTTSCHLHFALTRSATSTTLHTVIPTHIPGYRTILTTLRWKVIRSFSENYSRQQLLVSDNLQLLSLKNLTDWLIAWFVDVYCIFMRAVFQ